MLWGTGGGGGAPPSGGGSGYDSATQQGIAEAVAARREAGEAPPPPESAWIYRSTQDPMSDRWTHIACVTSRNETRVDWPYRNGPARLCIRQSPSTGWMATWS